MAFHSQPLVQEGNFFPPPHHQLRSSRYLEPVQELLNELCSLGAGKNAGEPKRKAATGLREEGASSTSSSLWNQTLSSLDISELKRRYTQLVSMLEELDRRYRRYCEQMRAVVSGFEVAAGEGAAKVYSTLAMKGWIAGQMKEIKKATGDKDAVAPGASRGETPRLRLLDHHLRQQKAFQQSEGLPERSVSVLRAWLFEHFLHPYPSDVDKHVLARQTGLSRSQVCNWFINARVRLWKPMVEEMYLEETKEKLENQSSRGNMVQQGASQTGQSQNPNALGIQHLQLQDEQNSRPLQLGGSDEDSLSSVVNSSHNSDRGDPAMSGKNPLYGPPPRQYNPLQHLARPDHNFGLVDVDFSSYSECGSQQGFGNGVSLTLGLQQHNGGGVSLCFSPDPKTASSSPRRRPWRVASRCNSPSWRGTPRTRPTGTSWVVHKFFKTFKIRRER
ncbi:unnamed protein product [Spirodela intermedia]|uniref:Homeobox domain-containing protein n=1 Tax=Spirodela intermedia TaxID=51605 RepID=A0A7I8J9Z1_SPIIN|nr:unnamed protein product [Spirodela intermedia]CAA6666967.1 unnamed protein product [Spirodela intermedia]